MGQALYRDYRPKSFGEVIGQDHITKTLKNAITSGRISHAYLFTGPRGVGKTSVARILAHEVNKLPYTDESIHLDIIEIDAASNRRIDEIRDLRDKVRVAPSIATYKVYIIDEVHMLTREAFNALLKTLEEPPAHCIFILATTEAHKLPETIVSRTQRFEFKSVSRNQSSGHLKTIAKKEKIDIEPEALDILADWGNGSFRDSISYLDQLSSFGKKITADDVRELLGLPAKSEIDQLYSLIESSNAKQLVDKLKLIEQKGVKPQLVASALSEYIRTQVINNGVQSWQVSLLSSLLDVSSSHRAQEQLEISLLGALSPQENIQPRFNQHTDKQKIEPKPTKAALDTVKPEITEATPTPNKSAADSSMGFDLSMWGEVVERSKKEAASIYTALRLAKPIFQDDRLVLGFEFPLHQKKIAQAKNIGMISDIIEEVSGAKVPIEVVVDKSAPIPEVVQVPTERVPVNAISDIFGSAEVLEA